MRSAVFIICTDVKAQKKLDLQKILCTQWNLLYWFVVKFTFLPPCSHLVSKMAGKQDVRKRRSPGVHFLYIRIWIALTIEADLFRIKYIIGSFPQRGVQGRKRKKTITVTLHTGGVLFIFDDMIINIIVYDIQMKHGFLYLLIIINYFIERKVTYIK